jgi:LmbE family N-acetylglucosaminyl deacetylase
MRTLVVVPHLDDEALSCGALIRERMTREHKVTVIAVYGRKYDGKQTVANDIAEVDCAMRARAKLLNYSDFGFLGWEEGCPDRRRMTEELRELESLVVGWDPNEVVIPGSSDLNQDHRYLNELMRIVLRPGNRANVTRILEFIAHDQLHCPEANYAVSLDYDRAAWVQDAISQYDREARTGKHPRSPENIEARWRYFGAQFGLDYAEPYRLVSAID